MAAKNSVSGNGSGEGDAGGGAEVQRWTAGRKAAIVLDIIKGKSTPADAARLHGLTVADVESWVDKFVEGGKEGLRAVPRELEAKFEAERKDLLAKVGELTLQVDAFKKGTRSASALMGASGQAASL
ncbi:MAG: transposase [Phycisphaerales bacterium]